MKVTKDIHELLAAYLKGDISEEDLHVLQSWMAESESHRRLVEDLGKENLLREDVQLFASFDTKGRWELFRNEVGDTARKRRSFRRIMIYAAAVAVLLSVGGGLFWHRQWWEKPEIPKEIVPIACGQTQAVLVLDGGQEVTLEGLRDTSFQVGDKSMLAIDDEGGLSYKLTAASSIPETHLLRIPRGGEYNIVLDDGTKVWLNSASELKYPVHFAGGDRLVELVGEAYFQVAHDEAHPFIVKTKGMDVRVLGTSFNVSAYPDDTDNSTTLVEGCVEIQAEGLPGQIVLSPGEQAVVKDDQIVVRQVDTKLYTSWVKDRFSFESAGLEDVLRKLSRWYNVDFVFQNSRVKEKFFTGNIPKYEDISGVFKIIEMTTDIHFEIKDKTIIVR